ncbi:MAG: AMP-binding protein [Candidatus Obscuribacterales bacterium]|nr:AMP-binding protein [Candidatus Obscuribacterales bacterium]
MSEKTNVDFRQLEQIRPDRPAPKLPSKWSNLSAAVIHTARRLKNSPAVADSSGKKYSYIETLTAAMALAQTLERKLLDAEYVGVLMPPTVPTVVVNLALTLLGRVAVNLSYGDSVQRINGCIKRCGIRQLISSEAFLSKTGLQPDCETLKIEELSQQVTTGEKRIAYICARYLPVIVLAGFFPGLRRELWETATVIFTSGSTGDPKGVVLSHSNILHNIMQIKEHGNLDETAVVLGILPLFHSLGYTVTLWTILVLGYRAVYHTNPLEAKKIGELMQEHGVTVMACTPTLMRAFLKRCTKEQFATVKWLLLGSEKLKPELARDIQDKLGIEPVEGYGLTQTSPVVAADVPMQVKTPDGRMVYGNKLGTVGQLVAGTAVAIVDVNSGKILPRGKGNEGVIYLAGPQVMQGYLGMPEETARVLQNGWFNTEDIGWIDEDGFLHITDRLSRFAKVAGEMVPLGKLEETLRQVCQARDELVLAVTAIPDLQRGERIAVVYTAELGMSADEAVKRLQNTDTPRLWMPSARDFVLIEKMPVGSTGKLDLKEVKRLAAAALGSN